MKYIPVISLHDFGLKDTLPRRTVLRVLEKTEKPLTVRGILHQLRKEDTSIGLVTIYRVIEALLRVGLVHRHPVGGTFSLCTIPEVRGHHVLLRCLYCGNVDEAHDHQLCRREEAIAKSRGFRTAEHVSELVGTCSQCRQ